MRRAGGNNKAHHQKRSRQDAGGVQGEAGRCYGGHKGRRRQPRRRVHRLHLMLHNALNRAVKERLILRNPTEDCIAPKVQKFEMQILQPEHIKTYLDAADKRGLLPMFYLELVSGLRKGELTALLWSDLDIQNKTISVSKQYVKNPQWGVDTLAPQNGDVGQKSQYSTGGC